MKKYTAIARTGTFRDSHGIRRIFTKDDLKKIAENYNSSTTDAPLVIGHVQDDSAPAYGWIEDLVFNDEKLCASFSYVSEEVKNLVYKGVYRNVSMSVDMENHRLLHVALLGAAAPAIDGLGAINLSHDTNESVYTFSFETKEENMNETELKKRIEELEKLNEELRSAVEKLKAEKETAEKQTEEAKAEFSAYLTKQKDDARKKRIERLVAEGKLQPAEKDNVYVIATALANQPAQFSANNNEVSFEDLYFQTWEEKEKSDIFAEFSHSPAHAQNSMEESCNPETVITKI